MRLNAHGLLNDSNTPRNMRHRQMDANVCDSAIPIDVNDQQIAAIPYKCLRLIWSAKNPDHRQKKPKMIPKKGPAM